MTYLKWQFPDVTQPISRCRFLWISPIFGCQYLDALYECTKGALFTLH